MNLGQTRHVRFAPRTSCLLLLALLCLVNQSFAATFFATDQASFNQAISVYSFGDTIEVGPGLYLCDLQVAVDGGRLVLHDGVTLRGTNEQIFLFDDDDTWGDIGITTFSVVGSGRLEGIGGIVRLHGPADRWHIEAAIIDTFNQVAFIDSGASLTANFGSILNSGSNAAFEVDGSLDLSYRLFNSSARFPIYAHLGSSVSATQVPEPSLLLLCAIMCFGAAIMRV